MKLSEVYRAFGEDSEAGTQARLLLDQQHWYASIAEFDPKTGDALPLGFDELVRRVADRAESTEIRDRLAADAPPSPHFGLLAKIAARNGLKGLSMGMSADYEAAIQLGATYVRVGSAIFGARG